MCWCYRSRELSTFEIGRLVSVTGVVTRTSEVRPELLQGTFRCFRGLAYDMYENCNIVVMLFSDV